MAREGGTDLTVGKYLENLMKEYEEKQDVELLKSATAVLAALEAEHRDYSTFISGEFKPTTLRDLLDMINVLDLEESKSDLFWNAIAQGIDDPVYFHTTSSVAPSSK